MVNATNGPITPTCTYQSVVGTTCHSIGSYKYETMDDSITPLCCAGMEQWLGGRD